MEVTFPCRVSAGTDVSVLHYEDGRWKPLLSFVDESAGTVTACFGSFCPVRVEYRPVGVNPSLYYVKTDEDDPWVQTLEIRGDCWEILRRTNPGLYNPEVQKFIDDPQNYALAAPRLDPGMDLDLAYNAYMEANQIWGFIDPLINIGIETLPPESKSRIVSFMIDKSGNLSNAMSVIPFITMGVQLAYDLKDWNLNSIEPAGYNLYKNLLNASGGVYSLVTGYSHLGFTLAFLGVSVFGMELDYFVEAAKAAQAENIRDVYKAYYREVEPFDEDHWYSVFESAYWAGGGDPNRAMAQVKDAVDAYCEKFWTEVYKDSNDDLIFAAADAGYKNVFKNATPEQKTALTEQQKGEVWRLIETKAMKKIQRFLFERLQEDTLEQLDEIVRPYNLSLSFTIQESVDQQSADLAKYLGTTLALGVGGRPVPGWSLSIPDDEAYEDGWKTTFRCTVYGYMRMGMPNQVLVYASAEDLADGAKPLRVVDFTPQMEGNRETEIELGGSGGCHIYAYTRKGIQLDILVEGANMYGFHPDYPLRPRGQIRPGESFSVSVTSAEGYGYYVVDYTHDEYEDVEYARAHPGKRTFHVPDNAYLNFVIVINRTTDDTDGIMMAIEIVSDYTKPPVSSLEVDYRVLND